MIDDHNYERVALSDDENDADDDYASAASNACANKRPHRSSSVDICHNLTSLFENGFSKLLHSNRLLLFQGASSSSSTSSGYLLKLFNNSFKKLRLNQTSIKRKLNKHVMFADTLGLDLELIHTIQLPNSSSLDELGKLISRQSFFNSYNSSQSALVSHGNKQPFVSTTDKLIVPKFSLSPDNNYEKLTKNGICLNSVEICDESCVRGMILTLTKAQHQLDTDGESCPANTLDEQPAERARLIDDEFGKSTKSRSKQSKANNQLTSQLDVVYIIWTNDNWLTWKYQAAIKNNCKTYPSNGILKTYEFFLQNLDTRLQIGQTLQLIICHQIDTVVYKDTNDELCYKFECALKL